MSDALFCDRMEETINELFPKETPYRNQLDVIKEIITQFENKNIVLLQAPTGSGKSVMAYTIAKYFNTIKDSRTTILTSTKYLQDQYAKEFSDIQVLKGEDNYVCERNGKPCSVGACKVSNKVKAAECACPYKKAKKLFLEAPISMTNFACYTMLAKTTDENNSFAGYISQDVYEQNFLSKNSLLICDEAHTLESSITSALSFEINNTDLNKLFGKRKVIPEVFQTAESYAEVYKWLVSDIKPYLESIIKSMGNMDAATYLACKRYYQSIDNIIMLSSQKVRIAIETNEKQTSISFKPVNLRQQIKTILTTFNTKLLLMSGTILDGVQFMESIGMKDQEYSYIDMPSSFPIANRPIYDISASVGSLNYANWNNNKEKIVNLITKVAEVHSNERGLILTSSYKMAEEIIAALPLDVAKRVVLPSRTAKEEDIARILTDLTIDDAILISPSLYEGIDLKEELGRFCIIVKAPYGGLTSAYDKLRLKFDPRGYEVETLRRIMQGTGRVVRSPSDVGTCYLIDGNLYKVINDNISVVPKWYYNSIKKARLQ